MKRQPRGILSPAVRFLPRNWPDFANHATIYSSAKRFYYNQLWHCSKKILDRSLFSIIPTVATSAFVSVCTADTRNEVTRQKVQLYERLAGNAKQNPRTDSISPY